MYSRAIAHIISYPIIERCSLLVGRDALATAKNMELLSKVTEVLNQVVEYRTVRRQFPVQPSDPWIFPSNEKRAKSEKSAVDIVKEELAFDFYLREEPETKVADSELKEARFEISEGKDVDPLELEQSLLEQRPAEKETGGTELKDEASASTATEEPVAKQKEPSEEGRYNVFNLSIYVYSSQIIAYATRVILVLDTYEYICDLEWGLRVVNG